MGNLKEARKKFLLVLGRIFIMCIIWKLYLCISSWSRYYLGRNLIWFENAKNCVFLYAFLKFTIKFLTYFQAVPKLSYNCHNMPKQNGSLDTSLTLLILMKNNFFLAFWQFPKRNKKYHQKIMRKFWEKKKKKCK